MKRQILRVAGVTAIAAGGLLAAGVAAHADSGSSNGNQYRYIYQHNTVVCGNAVAVEAEVHNHCDGAAVTVDHDEVDWNRFITDLDLDYSGDSAAGEDGRFFHLDSRTWS
jgi:hypothetical protein